jgi:CRISPR-associated protein Csb2
MIALRIEFVAGQFHANPWSGASKDGETEWPPAPWRLLRAIVAGWQRNGAEDRATLQRVLNALAEFPVFDLPLVSSGHTGAGPLLGFVSYVGKSCRPTDRPRQCSARRSAPGGCDARRYRDGVRDRGRHDLSGQREGTQGDLLVSGLVQPV